MAEIIDERSEYILRVRGITPLQRATVEAVLQGYAKSFRNHSLTRIDRDERGSHAMHIRRKRLL